MTKGAYRTLKQPGVERSAVVKRRVDIPEGTTVTVTATGAAVGFGTAVIGGLPEGNVLFLGAVAYVSFTGPTSADLADTWNGDYSVGTAPTTDVTLSGSEVDVIASTAIGPAVAEVVAATRGVTGTDGGEGGLLAPLILNNTDGSLELNLNVLVDAADIANDASVVLTVSGQVYLAYCRLGDD